MIAIKSLFATALLSVFFTFQGNAQLDSISVSHHIAQLPDPDDSLVSIDVIYLDITVYDMNFLGELIITPYGSENSHPYYMFKFTKQNLLDFGFLEVGVFDSIVTIPMYDLNVSENFRFEISARNFQGAELPLMEYNYDAD